MTHVMPLEGLCPLFYLDLLVVTNRPVKLVLTNPADKIKAAWSGSKLFVFKLNIRRIDIRGCITFIVPTVRVKMNINSCVMKFI